MQWKLTLLKSIIYRIITIILGMTTAYIFTGDFRTALELSLYTEAIQSVNYFAFESVWNSFYERLIREKVSEEFRQREIDLKLTVGAIFDISKEFAEIDTFVPEIYHSLLKFYTNILENDQMEEYHDQILESKKHFEILNRGRDFQSE